MGVTVKLGGNLANEFDEPAVFTMSMMAFLLRTLINCEAV